jgi:hypothetical protein
MFFSSDVSISGNIRAVSKNFMSAIFLNFYVYIEALPGSLSSGNRGLFPLGQSWGEADHSPQTSAEVKKTWVYTSTPPYAFVE